MLDERAARELLISLNAPQELMDHCESVHSLSVKLADTLNTRSPAIRADKKLVSVGALLHDIGRTKTQGVDHGVAGAQILRNLNTANDAFLEKVARICERHIGGGITRAEAKKLGLPDGDYVPRTLEEKMISYCDNLVDEENGKIVIRGPDWVLEKYEKKHGKDSEPALMIKELNKFFEKILGD
jgi:uncharacterized protein (TIGR00295 family)